MLFKKKKNQEIFRKKVGDLMFGEKTLSAKIFNIFIILLILISSLALVLESVSSIYTKYGSLLLTIELIFIIIFSFEYFFRIYSARKRKKYIFSFYGIIDFISVFPALLSIFFYPFNYLLLLRIFRVFRIFRVLKVINFLKERNTLVASIQKSLPKIIIFLSFVFVVSLIFASLMYLIEGPSSGFKDIPTSLYWTIVTITTVGYGDLVPATALGKILSSVIMLSGYGVIAVPTGIVLSEYSKLNFSRKK